MILLGGVYTAGLKKHTMDMFDNSNLVSTIGEYASIDFDKGIDKTINWLKNSLML